MKVLPDTTISRTSAFMCVNSSGHFAMAMTVELPPMQRLNKPVVIDARSLRLFAYRTEPTTSRLEEAEAANATVPDAALAVIPQVIGEDVVTGIMQMLQLR